MDPFWQLTPRGEEPPNALRHTPVPRLFLIRPTFLVALGESRGFPAAVGHFVLKRGPERIVSARLPVSCRRRDARPLVSSLSVRSTPILLVGRQRISPPASKLLPLFFSYETSP